MLDRLGKTLATGDRVVYTQGRYSNIHEGVVAGFTPQRVQIRSDDGKLHAKDPIRVVKVDAQ